jgi:small subunit ribosomal protein S1
MTESFAELFQQSIVDIEMRPGAIVKAKIIKISDDNVIVSAGLKSEDYIPVTEFQNEAGELSIEVGDFIDVALETVEDGFGETRLSRERAKRMETWRELEAAHEQGAIIKGVITDRVKGGFTVEINNVSAFLPGSLVDIRPVRDTGNLEGKELEFKVIKMDSKRNNIVVSRRAVVESESSAERTALLENLHEGQVLAGIVKNLTDYGAFIDLGGIDGLLHITDISWKRVKHPSEVLTVGDEIEVKVLRFDREKNRVSLGVKQLGDDPWVDLVRRYPEGKKLVGKVTNLTDYGCFVEIEDGVEGLVHMSEMDWTNKNIHPSKVVSLGDEVEVLVLEIDEERRRISLGMKQCQDNPWQQFADGHQKGEKVSGAIRSITDFGIFIGLAGGIDGLIHLSDISWEVPGEQAVRDFKKGQEVEAVILAIDSGRERISLGVKQLVGDPFGAYADQYSKGSIVTGKVTEVDAKGALIELTDNVFGKLKAADIAHDKVLDARTVLNVGDEVEAKIINVDKKTRAISLSIKAKDAQETAEALKEYKRSAAESSTSGTLGDLFKEEIDNQASEAE